jgi:hypothetical protein
MFRLSLTLVATLRSALRTQQDLILENLALRHQPELLTRTDRHPRFRPVDRLLWVGLRRCWAAWRGALVLVQPARGRKVRRSNKNIRSGEVEQV